MDTREVKRRRCPNGRLESGKKSMGEIKAGVTLMQDFCRPNSDKFKSYVDYIDRVEAQRGNAVETYNLFHDYMGNPNKSTGLFTRDKDNLMFEEKRELKAVFETAQRNESLMWQTVISFDNQWLENNGLYDRKNSILDEQKLKEVARLAINRMLKNEGLDHAVWSAAIHYNTDNIHIHVATVEPFPIREKIIYQGKEEVRGKFKLKNIEMCKSIVANEIMQTREVNLKLNQIIRKNLVETAREWKFAEDPHIRKKFLELYESLTKVDRKLWNYGNPVMQPYRTMIDEISRTYIEKYHSDEYKEFRFLLEEQSRKYAQAYGKNVDRSFEQGKEQDLLKRMGNSVLNAVKMYEKQIEKKEDILEEKMKSEEKREKDIKEERGEKVKTRENRRENTHFEKGTEQGKATSKENVNHFPPGQSYQKIERKKYRRTITELDRALFKLQRSFRQEEVRALKNIRQYDREQEYELEI